MGGECEKLSCVAKEEGREEGKGFGMSGTWYVPLFLYCSENIVLVWMKQEKKDILVFSRFCSKIRRKPPKKFFESQKVGKEGHFLLSLPLLERLF